MSLLCQLQCHCNPDHDKFSSLSNTTQTWQVQVLTLKTVSNRFRMPVRPMLLHRMALVSFRLFCKKLGNSQVFFG